MPALLAEPIVYDAAIAALKACGFQVWKRDWRSYGAERDGYDFEAENPIALLGLTAAYFGKQDGVDEHGLAVIRALPTPLLDALHRDEDGVILNGPQVFTAVAPSGYREPIQGITELIAYPEGPRLADPRSAALRSFLDELTQD